MDLIIRLTKRLQVANRELLLQLVSWDATNYKLTVSGIIPFDTGDVSKGLAVFFYEFSEKSSVIDFIVLDSGINYTAAPTISVEDIGDIQATEAVES